MKSDTLQYFRQLEKSIVHSTLGMIVTKQPSAVKLRLRVSKKKCDTAIETTIAMVTDQLHKLDRTGRKIKSC